MDQTQAASVRLADATGARLVALWALVEASDLDIAEFRRIASSVVAAANTQGVTLADLGLTAEVASQLHRITAPLGMRPSEVQVDQARIARDIDRILADAPESATTEAALEQSRDAQLTRLGRSEVLLTVATAVGVGMALRKAKGWTRQLTGTSCPQCEEWADGVLRPTDVRMARHIGCDCIQRPQF